MALASTQEFVTPEQLENELRELVHLHSGKLSLVDVPELLGIDLPHIERAAERLVHVRTSYDTSGREVLTPYAGGR